MIQAAKTTYEWRKNQKGASDWLGWDSDNENDNNEEQAMTFADDNNHNHNHNHNYNDMTVPGESDKLQVLLKNCNKCKTNCSSEVCQWFMKELIVALATGEIDCCGIKKEFKNKLKLERPESILNESDDDDEAFVQQCE